MAYLVNPPSYLSLATFKGMANDLDISSYTDAQLIQKLNAGSAWANSIMRRNLLAQEQTIRYIGDGTDKLDLGKEPLLYIKRAQIVIPGPTGLAVPVNELLVDYEHGEIFEYAPLYFAGAGYRSIFPKGAPFDVTLGWGYGYTVAVAPPIALSDVSGSGTGLTAGAYNVAVTAKTFWGETSAIVQQYTNSSGFINIVVTSGIGVYTYRVYLSSAAHNTTLNGGISAGVSSLVVTSATGITANAYYLLDTGVGTQEVVQVASSYASGTTIPLAAATANAHLTGVPFIPAPMNTAELPVTAFGGNPITFIANSLVPSNNLVSATLPTTDTSAPPLPWELQEAVRLLVLSSLYEQNNLANRGLYQQKSGERSLTWKSTEGMSGKGVPTMASQAEQLLTGYKYQGIV